MFPSALVIQIHGENLLYHDETHSYHADNASDQIFGT